ncbi:MAG: extracellular solute-binding protein [Brevinematales bacterium]|nr:extracellular solute-binding protein [Brevinematales bacterium]
MSKNKLKIWLVSESVFWKSQTYVIDYAENFSRKESFTIEWRFIPWINLWNELTTSFKSKNPPDIFEIGSSWISTFAEMNFLAPISTNLRNDYINEFVSKISIINNEIVAVPWYLDLSILIGRNDVLQKLNIKNESFTLESFFESCKIIGQNIPPLGLSFRPEPSLLHNLIPFFWANGYEFPDFSKGNFNIFNDKTFIDTLLYIANLWYNSKMPKTVAFADYFSIQEAFFREKGFVFFITHWLPDFLNILNSDKNTNTFKIFEFPQGSYGSFQWSGGSFLAISSTSKKKELCYEFIKHFISDEFLIQKIKKEGKFSPYESVYDTIENNNLKKIKKLIKNSKTYPPHPLWFSIEKFLYRGLSEILWNLIDNPVFGNEIKTIAEKWDKNLNKLLDIKWGII